MRHAYSEIQDTPATPRRLDPMSMCLCVLCVSRVRVESSGFSRWRAARSSPEGGLFVSGCGRGPPVGDGAAWVTARAGGNHGLENFDGLHFTFSSGEL